jgi:DNA-binding transcriptional MerR regulator
MEDVAQKLYQTKEFARRTGVTVRTLHLYDRIGLLKPAARTESGYRLYGDDELERLEQILALRFVGFSLKQIKELLRGSAWPLVVALRMQREVVAQRKRQLERAMDVLEEAERVLTSDAFADRWQTLRTVMERFEMANDYEWTQRYYSEEARARIAQRMKETPQDVVEQGWRDWTALIAEVEGAAERNEDPSGSHAQSLARRWSDLVRQFTRGDTDIHEGLNRLWSDSSHWPKDFQLPWSDAADAFIKKVLDCGH